LDPEAPTRPDQQELPSEVVPAAVGKSVAPLSPGGHEIRLVRYYRGQRPRAPDGDAITVLDPPPATTVGRLWRNVKRVVIGRPIASTRAIHERLTRVKALAVLSSDAISSVAYGPEAALLVLSAAGASALALNLPISAAILLLLIIVTLSYRQTIFAYPSGGGSYIVASENLGRIPSLVAAAALMIDYVLTVAVSVASGVAALVSAVPALAQDIVPLALAFVAILAIGNLRGVREAGALFAAPTYAFIVSLYVVIAVGLVRVLVLHDSAATGVPRTAVPAMESVSVLLVLKAFSSGCTAMTGVEAVSNGVPVFQPPESRNAATTMLWMSGILGTLFVGIVLLFFAYGLVPDPSGNPTMLSQLTEQVVGRGWFYYLVQAATLLILVLAANTSYADFPRLSAILARDDFLPHLFGFRGDRLAFSVGIGALSVLAAILLVLFHGSVDALIPLFAVGVFVAFTMSQAGMVAHWRRTRGPHWRTKALINGIGATACAVVALVAGATKFVSGEPLFEILGFEVRAGSWIVIALVPLLIANFLGIHGHYQRAEAELAVETPLSPDQIKHQVVVPIGDLNRVAIQTLAYAASIAPGLAGPAVTAVHVSESREEAARVARSWREHSRVYPFLDRIRLTHIVNPYRGLIPALMEYVDEVDARHPGATITVVLPELVPAHWWEQPLHTQSALRLKAALLFRPGTVVTSVPFHLEEQESHAATTSSSSSPEPIV
jgi:amino acid transporter